MKAIKLEKINIPSILNKKESFTTKQNTLDQKENGKKLLLLAALGTATIGVAAILITKQKNLNTVIKFTQEQEKLFQELLEKGQIDQKHLDFFKDIYSRSPRELTPDFVYKKLLEFTDFGEIQPKLIKDKKIGSGMMFYDNFDGTITINPRDWSIGGLRHELVHADQTKLMYKAFGKEKLCEAYADCTLLNMEKAGKLIGKTEQEIQDIKAAKIKEYLESFNEEYYKKAIAGSKKLTPEEYARAERCLDNARYYNGHTNGIIEREAYSTEIEFEEMQRRFLNIIKNNKKN